MLTFITLGVLIAVGIVILIINGKKWYEDWIVPVVGGFVVCAAIVVIVLGVSLFTIERDFDYIEERYCNLMEQVEYVDVDNIVTDANLRNQVLEMNNTIAKHRVYCDNPWVGPWYSERIGNLENLTW